MKSPIVLLEGLITDVVRLSPGTSGTDRDIITIRKRFKHEGYGFLTVTLPILCTALERGLETGRFACPLGFKRTKGGAIPRLFSGMLCKVFDAESGLLVASPCVETVKNLRQILRIYKKVQPEGDQALELDRLTRADFVALDGTLDGINFPSREAEIVKRVSALCLPGLIEFDPDRIRPKHGPGAVCEGDTPNQKWSRVVKAVGDDYFDIEMFGMDTFAYLMDPSLLTEKDSLASMPTNHRSHFYRGTPGDFARLVTVPKTFNSLRTITVEPCLSQFLQQGLNALIREEIPRCRVLRKCLALTDQSKNQQLALLGSRTGKWATLDLKSASDLLSLRLINLIFDRHDALRHALVACRSEVVKSDSVQIDVLKYAGMGNATTFPVQSVTFAIVALAAMLDQESRSPTLRNLVAISSKLRVFGDDIIVDSKFVNRVVTWLEMFGLKVNTDKSFAKGNFRESCGVDAYKGVNVTPIYLRVRPDDSSKDASPISSLVATSNQLWMAGYYLAATLLADEVEERLGRRLPLVRPDSAGLGWHTRQGEYHVDSYNKVLHRYEVSTYTIQPRKRKDVLDGYPALLKYFIISLAGNDETPTHMDGQRSESFKVQLDEDLANNEDPIGDSPECFSEAIHGNATVQNGNDTTEKSVDPPERVHLMDIHCREILTAKDHLRRSSKRYDNRIVWKRVAA
jgi:hypothetical protein